VTSFTRLTDENGQSVHEDCYVKEITGHDDLRPKWLGFCRFLVWHKENVPLVSRHFSLEDFSEAFL